MAVFLFSVHCHNLSIKFGVAGVLVMLSVGMIIVRSIVCGNVSG